MVQEEVENLIFSIHILFLPIVTTINNFYFVIIRAVMEAMEAAMVVVMMVGTLRKKSLKLSKKRYENDLT